MKYQLKDGTLIIGCNSDKSGVVVDAPTPILIEVWYDESWHQSEIAKSVRLSLAGKEGT